jgi:hypothetical protein
MKLAYWNGLNGDELVHVLGPEITVQRGLLHRPQGSLWRKLAHYLKDSERTLRLAFPPFALSQMNAVVDRLRGCRRCYPLGFHSPLFQLSVLERCPIHGDPLVEGCPRCSHPEPYAVTSRLHRDGHRCPGCRRSILTMQIEEPTPGFCRYCRGFPVGAVGSLAGFRPSRTQGKGRAPRRQHQSLIGWGLSMNGVRITRNCHGSLQRHAQ